jgi:hypothetical protein
MEWKAMKMKVKLATQLLSTSIADAIDFCREDLHLPLFAGSEATTEFIRVFDSLFDIFNSQNVMGKRFKAPLRKENEHLWKSLLTESLDYLRSLKTKDGKSIFESRLKTGFVGFVCGIFAIHGLYEDLIETGRMKYLLTYKLSQDHLELFFCAIRSCLGSSNNPTCIQFESAMKHLLMKNEIKG